MRAVRQDGRDVDLPHRAVGRVDEPDGLAVRLAAGGCRYRSRPAATPPRIENRHGIAHRATDARVERLHLLEILPPVELPHQHRPGPDRAAEAGMPRGNL